MTALVDQSTVAPVRKSITVQATVEHAFRVFTEEFDSWWPRSHHIGKSPMKRAIVEGRPGGRCYTEQEDGTDCDWGTVVVWEPPHRFVMAWQITGQWQFEPDLAKSSEAGPLCGARATNDLSEASDKVNGRVSICGLAVRLHTEEA